MTKKTRFTQTLHGVGSGIYIEQCRISLRIKKLLFLIRSNDSDMNKLRDKVRKHPRVYVVGSTVLIAAVTYAVCGLILQIFNCKPEFIQEFSQSMAGLSGIIGFIAISFFLLNRRKAL